MNFRGWRLEQFKGMAIGGAMLLAVILYVGCSDRDSAGGSSDDAGIYAISNKTIAGVAQKGPLKMGSSIVLMETEDSSLTLTGKNFISTVLNNDGEFRIDGVFLKSPYALLKAEGYFIHENPYSDFKDCRIRLNAASEVETKNQVNINLLTHLVHQRILVLVKEGLSFEKAKSQAELELVRVFGFDQGWEASESLDIFSGSENDAKLLAISVIVDQPSENQIFGDIIHGSLSISRFNQELDSMSELKDGYCDIYQRYLDTLALDFSDDGSLTDELVGYMLDYAMDHMNARFGYSGEHVKNAWDSVIAVMGEKHEKYIKEFINYNLTIDECPEGEDLLYDVDVGRLMTKDEICDGGKYHKILECRDGFWSISRGFGIKCFEIPEI